ncbi:MAG TPA: dienelactone hydrolase family protein [Acidimicrobiia bacterium]|nr:dienelactone hydrolase family protein [Acidimicrobiia bacterium]
MCFDADSHPPIEPVAGAATDHHRTTLTASDGNEFAIYEAFAGEGGATGVVILPDVRGLYRFYEELAVRLAEAGHDAIAIDYFGRTAGIGDRSDQFPYQEHVPQVTHAGMTADVAATVARLRETNPDRRIFTLGFCFGGSSAWQQAAYGHRLAGAIGFYGRPDGQRPQGAKTPIELAPEMASPILALMGGADPGIPAETVAAFDEALTSAGVEHEIVTYEGAPHSFFDRKYDDFADESADAWTRVLEFIRVH